MNQQNCPPKNINQEEENDLVHFKLIICLITYCDILSLMQHICFYTHVLLHKDGIYLEV